MFEIVYYVVVFNRHDGALVGDAPFRVDDYLAAIGEAQRLAPSMVPTRLYRSALANAGAAPWSRDRSRDDAK